MTIVVCDTETSATMRWSPNAVNLPCVAECGWGGCNGHANWDRGFTATVQISKSIIRLPVESAHSPFGHTVREECSGVNAVTPVFLLQTCLSRMFVFQTLSSKFFDVSIHEQNLKNKLLCIRWIKVCYKYLRFLKLSLLILPLILISTFIQYSNKIYRNALASKRYYKCIDLEFEFAKQKQTTTNKQQTFKNRGNTLKHKDSFGKSENLSKIFFAEILVFDHDYEGKSSSSNGLLWISFLFWIIFRIVRRASEQIYTRYQLYFAKMQGVITCIIKLLI